MKLHQKLKSYYHNRGKNRRKRKFCSVLTKDKAIISTNIQQLTPSIGHFKMPFRYNYTPLHSVALTSLKVRCYFLNFFQLFYLKSYLHTSYLYNSSLSKSMTFLKILKILNVENFHTKHLQVLYFLLD